MRTMNFLRRHFIRLVFIVIIVLGLVAIWLTGW